MLFECSGQSADRSIRFLKLLDLKASMDFVAAARSAGDRHRGLARIREGIAASPVIRSLRKPVFIWRIEDYFPFLIHILEPQLDRVGLRHRHREVAGEADRLARRDILPPLRLNDHAARYRPPLKMGERSRLTARGPVLCRSHTFNQAPPWRGKHEESTVPVIGRRGMSDGRLRFWIQISCSHGADESREVQRSAPVRCCVKEKRDAAREGGDVVPAAPGGIRNRAYDRSGSSGEQHRAFLVKLVHEAQGESNLLEALYSRTCEHRVLKFFLLSLITCI